MKSHESRRLDSRRPASPPALSAAPGGRRRPCLPLAPSVPDFRAIVESLPDIVARFDRRLRHLYVSPAVERATGRPAVEFIGRTNRELGMPSALADQWDAVLLRALETGETTEMEFSFPSPSGPRWYSGRVVPERGADGRVESVVTLVRDVTEREEAARRLRASEARHRTLVESSLDGVLLIAPGGRILSANPAACHMFGLDEEALRAGGWGAVMDRESAEAVAAAHALWEGGRFAGRLTLRRADGSEFPASLSASAFTDADGPRATVAVRDASDEVRAVRALREREERFRALTENGSDVTTILGTDGTMLYVSPSVRRVLGFDPAELEGTPVMAMFHPDDIATVAEGLGEIAAGPGASASRVFRMRHADGSWRHFEGTGINLVHLPAVGGIVTNSRDITERLRAEAALRERDEQLRQAQKMEAVGRLAGGIAHDFNNLLTAIKGNTQLLLQQSQEEAARGELLEVDRAADRAAALTRQLLAFGRRQVMHTQVLSLNDPVLAVRAMLRRLIPEPVELRTELADDLPAVEVDPGQLEQVIVNLAVNARDAMPRGGVLTLRTAAVEPEEAERLGLEARPLGYVLLEVSDTGEGIAAEVLPYVFEPFYTTKELGKGTGLGLSMVYGIVRQSGGRIVAHSHPGRGSIFTVYLPAVAVAPAPPPAPKPTALPATGGGEVVLLVEDEDSVRTLARRVLERAGYVVVAARGGEEALAAARELKSVDLMLTDVVMPRMSGAELAVAIRHLHPGLRTIYMSGYAGDDIEALGLADDETPFLPKPFTVEELTSILRQVLDDEGDGRA